MPTADGDADLRNYAQNNWNYVALFDDTNTEVLRVQIGNDSRFAWSSGSASDPLTLDGTVTGGDADVPTPTTFEYVKLFQSSSATTVMEDQQFALAQIQVDADSLDVSLDVSIN